MRVLLDTGCGGDRADKELNLIPAQWLDILAGMCVFPRTTPKIIVTSMLGGSVRSFEIADGFILHIPAHEVHLHTLRATLTTRTTRQWRLS